MSHNLLVGWILLMCQKLMAKQMYSEDTLDFALGQFNSLWKHNTLKSGRCLLSYFLLYLHMVAPTAVEDTMQPEYLCKPLPYEKWQARTSAKVKVLGHGKHIPTSHTVGTRLTISWKPILLQITNYIIGNMALKLNSEK